MPNAHWGGRSRRPKAPKLSRAEMEQRYRASIEAFTPLSNLDVIEPDEAEKKEDGKDDAREES